MERLLKVLIADDEESVRTMLSRTLFQLGHEVLSLCANGMELVQQSRSQCPDLIITDVVMPELDGLEAAKQIYEEVPVPIIVITALNDEDQVRRAVEAHALGYLVKPFREAELVPAIEIAMKRFAEFQVLHTETESLRHALEDRKIIERAKGLLMKQAKIDESEAFRRLRLLARSTSKKLAEVAQMIIVSSEAMKPSEQSI